MLMVHYSVECTLNIAYGHTQLHNVQSIPTICIHCTQIPCLNKDAIADYVTMSIFTYNANIVYKISHIFLSNECMLYIKLK